MLKLLKIFSLVFLLSTVTCKKAIIVEETRLVDIYYSSSSVCNCYKSGMSVLGTLIETNEDVYITLFQELRMNCLSKYGSQLFMPSYCNYPDSLQMLQDSLRSLGIQV